MKHNQTQSVRIDKDLLRLVRKVAQIRGGTIKFNMEKLIEEGVSYFYNMMLNLKRKSRGLR